MQRQKRVLKSGFQAVGPADFSHYYRNIADRVLQSLGLFSPEAPKLSTTSLGGAEVGLTLFALIRSPQSDTYQLRPTGSRIAKPRGACTFPRSSRIGFMEMINPAKAARLRHLFDRIVW
jgi:hypothetical protein